MKRLFRKKVKKLDKENKYIKYWKFFNDDKEKTGVHLVVDDNEINRAVAKAYLKNYIVIECKNGEEAIEKIQEDPNKFDMIWMDIRMPVLNGLDASVKARDLGCTTPIIALTAEPDLSSMDSCIESGMTDILIKPIKNKAIMDLINLYN